MRIEHARRPERGVTKLAYVGDDGLPVSTGKPAVLVALGALALLWWATRR